MTQFPHQRARQLRRQSTPFEHRFWAKVRNRQLGGLKFRRQAPVGPYFADFLCEEARLIVELDGAVHGREERVEHDAARDAFLARKGYETIRLSNIEFARNEPYVLDYVHRVALERIAATGSYSEVSLPKPPR